MGDAEPDRRIYQLGEQARGEGQRCEQGQRQAARRGLVLLVGVVTTTIIIIIIIITFEREGAGGGRATTLKAAIAGE